jgi:DNA-binding response OmpR family regulator
MGKTILVIDDDQNMHILMKMIYGEGSGFRIDEAYSPEEALQYLEINDEPDLIFLDIMMPERSGLEFLDVLNEKDITAPVIMLTAVDRASAAVEAMKKGADDYIVKPVDADIIRTKVDQVLTKRKKD